MLSLRLTFEDQSVLTVSQQSASWVWLQAAELLATAVAWIRQTALPQVPDAVRESFLDRNPVTRVLLTAESRRR